VAPRGSQALGRGSVTRVKPIVVVPAPQPVPQQVLAPAPQPVHQQILQVDARAVSPGASQSDVLAAMQTASIQTAQVAEVIHEQKITALSSDAQSAIRAIQLEKEYIMRTAQSQMNDLRDRRTQEVADLSARAEASHNSIVGILKQQHAEIVSQNLNSAEAAYQVKMSEVKQFHTQQLQELRAEASKERQSRMDAEVTADKEMLERKQAEVKLHQATHASDALSRRILLL
jgi:hypothetical protein